MTTAITVVFGCCWVGARKGIRPIQMCCSNSKRFPLVTRHIRESLWKGWPAKQKLKPAAEVEFPMQQSDYGFEAACSRTAFVSSSVNRSTIHMTLASVCTRTDTQVNCKENKRQCFY